MLTIKRGDIMKDFIKKHYLFVTNIICAIFVAMTFFVGIFAVAGFICWLWCNLFFRYGGILFLVLTNVFAFFAVKENKHIRSVVLSILLGFVGSFIAVNTVNFSLKTERAIKIIFSIFVWLFVWIWISFLLAYSGDYKANLAIYGI